MRNIRLLLCRHHHHDLTVVVRNDEFLPLQTCDCDAERMNEAILELREALVAEKVGCGGGGGAPGRCQEHRRAAEGEGGGGFARRLQAALQLRRPEAGLGFRKTFEVHYHVLRRR